MAITTVNLSDPVSTWVTKTNEIATNVGDKTLLQTSATSDLVAAINEVNTLVNADLNDSAEILRIFGAGQGLTYDSSAGTFSIVDSGIDGAMLDNDVILERHLGDGIIVTSHVSAGAIDSSALGSDAVTNAKIADSAIGFENMQASSIKSVNFASSTTLLIKDSAGTTLKTIYSPGS